MLKTPLCDLLGIDVPVICAPFGLRHEVDLAAQAQGALTRARNTATARRRRATEESVCTPRPRTGGPMSFTDARRAVVEDRRRVALGLNLCKGASE
jgi:hypothetical protein